MQDTKNIFVLMPFVDEFDDVYLVVHDAVRVTQDAIGQRLRCFRADDISKPGRITEQIMESIRDADLLIADLSGNNPNVMYELGYGHALCKPTIIINQEVSSSPFDVKDFRQIVYDRNRLVKDCRPSLIAALRDLFSTDVEVAETQAPDSNANHSGAAAATGEHLVRDDAAPLRPGSQTVALVQELHLKLQFANSKSDIAEVKRLARDVQALLGRITVASSGDPVDVRNTAAAAGNCAVEVEKAELPEEAEDLYRRSIGLFPRFHGIRLQYADFLLDLGRIDEARNELDRAAELEPDSDRIERVRTKMAMKTGAALPEIAEKLKRSFDADPSNRANAAAYLMYLHKTNAPLSEFEAVCASWREASPPSRRHEADRALADHLATSDEPGSDQRAIDLYEDLLQGALLDAEDRHAVLHNVATLYATMDKNDEAIARWKEAYRMNPNHPAVKAAFSQRLAAWGKLEMAMAVIQGRALPKE